MSTSFQSGRYYTKLQAICKEGGVDKVGIGYNAVNTRQNEKVVFHKSANPAKAHMDTD